eukprot:TRINITY_DN98_c0_g1_i3.p1 TRINITY_DN98_c0_g1~~TRINITY_DN98_c0_g1_i3.p1  ORF type:complete len:702 (-),score=50.46 TRINITY_DN98_c0_g1_i3:93-2198(-)
MKHKAWTLSVAILFALLAADQLLGARPCIAQSADGNMVALCTGANSTANASPSSNATVVFSVAHVAPRNTTRSSPVDPVMPIHPDAPLIHRFPPSRAVAFTDGCVLLATQGVQLDAYRIAPPDTPQLNATATATATTTLIAAPATLATTHNVPVLVAGVPSASMVYVYALDDDVPCGVSTPALRPLAKLIYRGASSTTFGAALAISGIGKPKPDNRDLSASELDKSRPGAQGSPQNAKPPAVVVVGDHAAESAIIFVSRGGEYESWASVRQLSPPAGAAVSRFGETVAAHETRLAVAASGVVFVFVVPSMTALGTPNAWAFLMTVRPATSGDRFFGAHLAFTDSHLAVSALSPVVDAAWNASAGAIPVAYTFAHVQTPNNSSSARFVANDTSVVGVLPLDPSAIAFAFGPRTLLLASRDAFTALNASIPIPNAVGNIIFYPAGYDHENGNGDDNDNNNDPSHFKTRPLNSRRPITRPASKTRPLNSRRPITRPASKTRPLNSRQPATRRPSKPRSFSRKPRTRRPSKRRSFSRKPMTRRPSKPRSFSRKPRTRRPSKRRSFSRKPMTRRPSKPRSFSRKPRTRRPSKRRSFSRKPMTRRPSKRRSFSRRPNTRSLTKTRSKSRTRSLTRSFSKSDTKSRSSSRRPITRRMSRTRSFTRRPVTRRMSRSRSFTRRPVTRRMSRSRSFTRRPVTRRFSRSRKP